MKGDDIVIDKRLSVKKIEFLLLAVLLIVMNSSCGSQIFLPDTREILSMSNSQSEDVGTNLSSPPAQLPTVPEGYRAVCFDGAAYIAVGTKGRVDRIKPDQTVTRLPAATTACLNGVISTNYADIAVGDGGVILSANQGGNFKEVKSGTTNALYSITVFCGTFLACGSDGTILSSSDGEHWELVNSGIENDILSISANENMCMAVTKESEILISSDGKTWNVMDYNTFYEGCAEPCTFRSISACGNAFFIAGEYLNYPGSPAILSSDSGEIWMEHVLVRINDRSGEEFYPLIPNAVIADGDQLVTACNGGKLLTVTECIVCNKLDVLCERNINDLVAADGFLALVGDDFWFDIRNSDTARQYGISAGQALEDYHNGAYIVDVRTEDAYALQHIKGSINIPVHELEAKLEKEIPEHSRKVIFYCQKGVSAQMALEKALLMGYEKVYNLGGINDWPYDTETGGIPVGK